VLTAYLTDPSESFDFKSMDAFTVSESSFRDFISKSGKPREELDDATVDSFRKEVQESLSHRERKPFWVKTHNANIVRNGQRLIFPVHPTKAYLVSWS
jgi:hypothetical protein